MYDNQYEKYVKTQPFIVSGWDSAYFNTYLLLLGYTYTLRSETLTWNI